MSWSNLTMADMPGTPYLMPFGIGGLSVPMAGVPFDMGGMRGLQVDMPGAGDGGGSPYHPMNQEIETDSAGYISINYAVAPTADDSHANLLYKEVAAFHLREPPSDDMSGEVLTIVPINWLNVWLDKMYKMGFQRFEAFASDFLTRNQSHFPKIFAATLKNPAGQNRGHSNTFRQTLGSAGKSGWGSMAIGPRYGSSSSEDEDDDDHLVSTVDHVAIMNAFVQYLAENMPPPDLLYNNSTSLEWMSTVFETHKGVDVAKWLDNFLTKINEEKKRTSGGSTSSQAIKQSMAHLPFSQQRAAEGYLEILTTTFEQVQSLKIAEASAGDPSQGKKNGSSWRVSTQINPLEQNDLEKCVVFLKGKYEAGERMQEEVLDFFQSSIKEPFHLQFTKEANGIQYLHRGGFFKNWGFTGIVQTVTDDSADKHSWGKPFASFPTAKIIVERETDTYNLWGGDLKAGTKLYWKLERSPLSGKSKEINAVETRPSLFNIMFNSHKGEDSVSHEDGIYLEKIKNICDQYEAAWRDYGSFRIIPYHNGLLRPVPSEYVNIFGVKEKAHYIPAGTVKYDITHHDYNYATRNLALGLPSSVTNIPPSLEASKAAMASLPRVTILVRC